MTQIRSFQNADLPTLLELWIQHWSAIGLPPQVDMPRLEQGLLARTFFDSSHLLLATSDDKPVAWLQFHCLEDGAATITGFCLARSCDASVAGQLLSAAEEKMVAAGSTVALAGAVRDDQFGYAGLDPIGHGCGIPVQDHRLASILSTAGYAPQKQIVQMHVETSGYRAPVSREALQLRRSCRLEFATTHPDSPRRAAALSHLDIESVVLRDNAGVALSQLHLWLSDAEAEVMDPAMALLDLSQANEAGKLDVAQNYLVSAIVPTLAERRIARLITAIDKNKNELLSQLARLKFAVAGEGVRWSKTLP